MSPNVGRRFFQIATTAAPFLVPVLYEIQRQISGHAWDWWQLGNVATGAVISLIVAAFHVARAGTETAERAAEVATSADQDADKTVEQTPAQIASPPPPGTAP